MVRGYLTIIKDRVLFPLSQPLDTNPRVWSHKSREQLFLRGNGSKSEKPLPGREEASTGEGYELKPVRLCFLGSRRRCVHGYLLKIYFGRGSQIWPEIILDNSGASESSVLFNRRSQKSCQ